MALESAYDEWAFFDWPKEDADERGVLDGGIGIGSSAKSDEEAVVDERPLCVVSWLMDGVRREPDAVYAMENGLAQLMERPFSRGAIIDIPAGVMRHVEQLSHDVLVSWGDCVKPLYNNAVLGFIGALNAGMGPVDVMMRRWLTVIDKLECAHTSLFGPTKVFTGRDLVRSHMYEELDRACSCPDNDGDDGCSAQCDDVSTGASATGICASGIKFGGSYECDGENDSAVDAVASYGCSCVCVECGCCVMDRGGHGRCEAMDVIGRVTTLGNDDGFIVRRHCVCACRGYGSE